MTSDPLGLQCMLYWEPPVVGTILGCVISAEGSYHEDRLHEVCFLGDRGGHTCTVHPVARRWSRGTDDFMVQGNSVASWPLAGYIMLKQTSLLLWLCITAHIFFLLRWIIQLTLYWHLIKAGWKMHIHVFPLANIQENSEIILKCDLRLNTYIFDTQNPA